MIRHSADERAARHLSNVEAWCRHFRAPECYLLNHRHRPAREDRCLIRATPEWLEWLEGEAIAGGAVCRRVLGIDNHRPFPTDELTAFYGWRGARTFAAIQIVEHRWGNVHALEVDFDLGNPQDLVGTVLHALEWAWNRLPRLVGRQKRRTDPFLVARWMRRCGIAA